MKNLLFGLALALLLACGSSPEPLESMHCVDLLTNCEQIALKTKSSFLTTYVYLSYCAEDYGACIGKYEGVDCTEECAWTYSLTSCEFQCEGVKRQLGTSTSTTGE